MKKFLAFFILPLFLFWNGPVLADVATGGTVSYTSDYEIHTFTTDGDLVVSTSTDSYWLLVGGGGGAGSWEGGGGGGGQVLDGTSTISADTYAIVIGAGGAGKDGAHYDDVAAQGGTSTFNGNLAIGGYGGRGGGAGISVGGNSGNGFAGGNYHGDYKYEAGGGAGASANGGNWYSDHSGNGGAGLGGYGGGGGGGGEEGIGVFAGSASDGGGAGSATDNGQDGTANTGGGGGGGAYHYGGKDGGDGGSGIFIIRFPLISTSTDTTSPWTGSTTPATDSQNLHYITGILTMLFVIALFDLARRSWSGYTK